MDFVEHTLTCKDVHLHYWTGGRTSAPLVVFTHGATIDHHEWDAALPIVGEHFRVLTWDMPAHGLSRPAEFSIDSAVDDLIALLDAVEVDQVILVGHSLGGNVHQELNFRYPGRVKAMFCLDCTWNFQKLTWLEKFMLNLAEPIFKIYPYQTLVDQSLRLTAVSKASQEVLRPAVMLHNKEEFVQILMAGLVCLHYEPGYTIGKPLLLMVGDKDTTGNIRKAMPAWAHVEPDCKLVIVPDAKHSPNLDVPDVFHSCMMNFLIKKCL
jgi:pimeloyl-ACP methyl ester carboxylesterase